MHEPLLHASDLVKTYGGTTALAGIGLTVHRGESIAIMGASGSGKTTLLHVLAGITTPDSGSVVYAGGAAPVQVSELPDGERTRLRREEFGFVFQQGFLLPELTAGENVALPLLMNGIRRKDAEAQAAAWLTTLGLAGMEGRRPGQLSGGQAQRVAIARAQATGASLTFADEPTGALDSATGIEVMTALLQSTVGNGRSLIVVTHDEAVAARCGRIVRVRDGRVVSDTAAVAR